MCKKCCKECANFKPKLNSDTIINVSHSANMPDRRNNLYPLIMSEQRFAEMPSYYRVKKYMLYLK